MARYHRARGAAGFGQQEAILLRADFDDAEATVEMVDEALSAFAVAPREHGDDLDEAERAEFEHEPVQRAQRRAALMPRT